MAAQGKSVESTPMDTVALVTTVLQAELGLKLEGKKMPLEVVVIDHAEKSPVEN
jgi:uncharacterized protein (TIGR03435 family)